MEPSISSSAIEPSAPGVSSSSWSRQPAALYLLLFLIACLPYLNTLFNGFVYDDHQQILENPFIQNTRYLKDIFTTGVWKFQGPAGHGGYFRPLMNFSYLVLYKLYGPFAFGYHLASLLLQGLLACVVFLVVSRWTRARAVAISAAVIFALHPVHSETVNWIADITDLEVTLFLLLAFWFYLGIGEKKRSSLLRIFGACVCYALALLAKEFAVAFPALAVVYEHFYRPDRAAAPFLGKVLRYAPLWAVLVLYFIARSLALGGFAPSVEMHRYGPLAVILTAFSLFAHYIWKMFWPVQLCMFYVFPVNGRFWNFGVISGILLAVLFFVLILALRRSQPVISFSLLWFALFLAPALNAMWLPGSHFSERYLFLPSFGFACIFAVLAVALWRFAAGSRPRPSGNAARWSLLQKILAISACAAISLSAARIVTRNRDWRDDSTLYARTLEQQPRATYIRLNLGAAYWNSGKNADAEREWRQALAEDPQLSITLTNLGMAALRENRYAEAGEYLQRARSAKPLTVDAFRWSGVLYEKLGEPLKAEEFFIKAVMLDPFDSASRRELARIYEKQGHDAEAVKQLEAATNGTPTFELWSELGALYWKMQRPADAERAFRSALKLSELDPQAHLGLARIFESRGERGAARKEYQAVLLMDMKNPEALAGIARLSSPGGP